MLCSEISEDCVRADWLWPRRVSRWPHVRPVVFNQIVESIHRGVTPVGRPRERTEEQALICFCNIDVLQSQKKDRIDQQFFNNKD